MELQRNEERQKALDAIQQDARKKKNNESGMGRGLLTEILSKLDTPRAGVLRRTLPVNRGLFLFLG